MLPEGVGATPFNDRSMIGGFDGHLLILSGAKLVESITVEIAVNYRVGFTQLDSLASNLADYGII